MSDQSKLPAIFDLKKNSPIIGPILAWNIDDDWHSRDGEELKKDDVYGVIRTFECMQCRGDGELIDTIMPTPGDELPDVDKLNEQIPEKEWPKGLDGQPRKPWVKQRVVHLVRPADAAVFTYINSTVGARIATDRLREKVDAMQMLRGRFVMPLVKLSSREMKTQYGKKRRPEVAAVDWRIVGGEGEPVPVLPAPPSKPIGTAPKDTPAGEFINDALPY